MIEGIAEKHISEVLKKYSPKGSVDMSEVKYACYDSGVILLAPYRRKGVIIGFLDYSRMTALEETISRSCHIMRVLLFRRDLFFMND